MATTTRKAKKAAKVIKIDNVPSRDGKPSEYSAEIVPGERITVYGTKVTGYVKNGTHRVFWGGVNWSRRSAADVYPPYWLDAQPAVLVAARAAGVGEETASGVRVSPE